MPFSLLFFDDYWNRRAVLRERTGPVTRIVKSTNLKNIL
jgi:hypothetical protein